MHVWNGNTMAMQVLSLVSSGVFDEIPELQIVSVECGIAWAAALRGWMVQMAGPAQSEFTWYGTFGLLITPGAVVGAAFGYGEYRRRTGGARSRWLTLAPLAFLVALTMPWIFVALITSGMGGGSIGVVTFGLAGGYALSGGGRRWARAACALLGVLGVLLMVGMASDNAPLSTARGGWVGLYASSLVALLCLACAIPQRIGRATALPAWAAVAVGALAGLAWSAALRAFMFEVAGDQARVDATGTFAFVLLPGAVIGANARVRDSIIGERAVVEPGCEVVSAVVGDGERITEGGGSAWASW
jgi:hypothetical protein